MPDHDVPRSEQFFFQEIKIEIEIPRTMWYDIEDELYFWLEKVFEDALQCIAT